jgi:hypothetical protein
VRTRAGAFTGRSTQELRSSVTGADEQCKSDGSPCWKRATHESPDEMVGCELNCFRHGGRPRLLCE